MRLPGPLLLLCSELLQTFALRALALLLDPDSSAVPASLWADVATLVSALLRALREAALARPGQRCRAPAAVPCSGFISGSIAATCYFFFAQTPFCPGGGHARFLFKDPWPTLDFF